MQLTYNNVAISGTTATGKGTLLHNLKPYLEPLGWQFAAGGQLNREQSGEHIAPSADRVSDEYNNYIEKRTEELFRKHKHYVIEAWLAGWVARDMADTLRVLLVCSHPAVTIDRVVNRDHVSVEVAKHILVERTKRNDQIWHKLYGEYNFQDPSYFHLVIDTYAHNPKEVTSLVLHELGYTHQK